jgi:hypothetical protein
MCNPSDTLLFIATPTGVVGALAASFAKELPAGATGGKARLDRDPVRRPNSFFCRSAIKRSSARSKAREPRRRCSAFDGQDEWQHRPRAGFA